MCIYVQLILLQANEQLTRRDQVMLTWHRQKRQTKSKCLLVVIAANLLGLVRNCI